MKTTEEQIEVMLAFVRSEPMQYRDVMIDQDWQDVPDFIDRNKWASWMWGSHDYRVKPLDNVG